nr:hypothetical protein [Tanacetum cinerariifolium]
VVIDAQFGEELERGFGLEARKLHGVARLDPGTLEGADAEHVGAWPDEGVPVAGRHAQVLAHRLAEDDFVGVVMAEGKGGIAVGTFARGKNNENRPARSPYCPAVQRRQDLRSRHHHWHRQLPEQHARILGSVP